MGREPRKGTTEAKDGSGTRGKIWRIRGSRYWHPGRGLVRGSFSCDLVFNDELCSIITFHTMQRQEADCNDWVHESKLRKQCMVNSAEILMFSVIKSWLETTAPFKDLLTERKIPLFWWPVVVFQPSGSHLAAHQKQLGNVLKIRALQRLVNQYL